MNQTDFKCIPVGTIDFTQETISITDPCYNKNVWCRINDVPIVPGTYSCYIYKLRKPDSFSEGRVFGAQIVLNDEETINRVAKNRSWRRLDTIGIDAGLAGFFQNKPDFDDDEWDDFCNNMFAIDRKSHNDDTEGAYFYESKTDSTSVGFYTSSGFGDGIYQVYSIKEKGGNRNVAFEIRFW